MEMIRTVRLAIFALLLLTNTLLAQSNQKVLPHAYEKILLPIQPSQIQGAFGSTWHTMSAAVSDDDRPVALKCYPTACLPLDANGAYLLQTNSSHPDPAFVYVPADQVSSVHLSLRTTATAPSGAAITMEIPIARERDFTVGTLHIQAVPIDRNSRLSLRVFDLGGRDLTSIYLRIYSHSGKRFDGLVVSVPLRLRTPSTPLIDGLPSAPAFVAIHDLVSAFPELAHLQLVNIEIEPTDPGAIWGFVTSTNNTTQQFNNFTDCCLATYFPTQAEP